MSENKIIEGDSLQILKQIEDESIDCIITDPPYNLSGKSLKNTNNKTGGSWYKMNETWDVFDDYLSFTNTWIKEATRILKKTNSSIIIFCSFHSIGEIVSTLKSNGFKILNIIVWEKTNAIPNITHRILTHSSEFIIWATNSEKWIFNYESMKKYADGKQLRDVWRFPVCQGKERTKHPTQKPLEIFKRLVEMASNEGDIILDPFCGSGTTLIAANQLNRKWIGIELKREYIEIANKRLEPYLKQSKLI